MEGNRCVNVNAFDTGIMKKKTVVAANISTMAIDTGAFSVL